MAHVCCRALPALHAAHAGSVSLTATCSHPPFICCSGHAVFLPIQGKQMDPRGCLPVKNNTYPCTVRYPAAGGPASPLRCAPQSPPSGLQSPVRAAPHTAVLHPGTKRSHRPVASEPTAMHEWAPRLRGRQGKCRLTLSSGLRSSTKSDLCNPDPPVRWPRCRSSSARPWKASLDCRKPGSTTTGTLLPLLLGLVGEAAADTCRCCRAAACWWTMCKHGERLRHVPEAVAGVDLLSMSCKKELGALLPGPRGQSTRIRDSRKPFLVCLHPRWPSCLFICTPRPCTSLLAPILEGYQVPPSSKSWVLPGVRWLG